MIPVEKYAVVLVVALPPPRVALNRDSEYSAEAAGNRHGSPIFDDRLGRLPACTAGVPPMALQIIVQPTVSAIWAVLTLINSSSHYPSSSPAAGTDLSSHSCVNRASSPASATHYLSIIVLVVQ